jgi:hypothetical protein
VKSLLSKWKTFLAKTEGSVGFEAIWAGLFITFFFAPTAFLFRFSETHLGASWAQRSAARDEAINGNCNGVFFLPIPIGGQTNVNSATVLDCTKLDGEKNLPSSDKFWKKMDTVSNAEFSNFTRDMKDKGDIKVHQGRSTVIYIKNLDLGDTNLLGMAKILIPKQSSILVPSTDYYIFDKAEWKEGHDKRIWSEFSSKHKKLFPEVYPSR